MASSQAFLPTDVPDFTEPPDWLPNSTDPNLREYFNLRRSSAACISLEGQGRRLTI